jgi:hypothetical protein
MNAARVLGEGVPIGGECMSFVVSRSRHGNAAFQGPDTATGDSPTIRAWRAKAESKGRKDNDLDECSVPQRRTIGYRGPEQQLHFTPAGVQCGLTNRSPAASPLQQAGGRPLGFVLYATKLGLGNWRTTRAHQAGACPEWA